MSGVVSLLQPYALGYLLLAFLPGPRALAAGLVAGLGVCGWAFLEARRDDSVGAVLAMAYIACAAFGVVAGASARGIVLAGRRKDLKPHHALIVHAAVFVLVPSATMFVSWRQLEDSKARMVAPAPACGEQLHEAKIGAVTLALPISHAIQVGEGFEFDPAWIFSINEHARGFCDHARARPPQLTNLQVDLSVRTSVQASQLYDSAFCAREQPYSWWTSSCRREGYERSKDFPEGVTVYVIGKYNAGKMHAWSLERQPQERERISALPQTRLEGGAVAYAETFHTYYTLDARPDFLARCHHVTSDPEDRLWCGGALSLGGGLAMMVDFYADKASYAADAEHAIARAQEIFEGLRKR